MTTRASRSAGYIAGYGINQFSVTVPGSDGAFHEEHGTIVTVYRHEPDGWHLSLVAPSVAETPGKDGS
jgi:ketosteroid isomerase-like protein